MYKPHRRVHSLRVSASYCKVALHVVLPLLRISTPAAATSCLRPRALPVAIPARIRPAIAAAYTPSHLPRTTRPPYRPARRIHPATHTPPCPLPRLPLPLHLPSASHIYHDKQSDGRTSPRAVRRSHRRVCRTDSAVGACRPYPFVDFPSPSAIFPSPTPPRCQCPLPPIPSSIPPPPPN